MNPVIVSIIIPAYNAERTLGDLLLALKSQSGVRGPFEIIVVDNGSSDRTAEIARAHDAIVLHQSIRGPSAARNMGLANARAEIIVCTDADTIPTRRWLASLLSVFDDPQVLQATGPIHGWQPSTGAERFACQREVYDCEKTASHSEHPFAIGMNHAVRRAAALAIGGWDENMTSGEDTDFGIRMKAQFASPICFVPQAILFHRHRSSDEALWKQARWHGAGYAMLRQKHRELLPWNEWSCFLARMSVAVLQFTAPLVTIGRALRLLSEQRAEFEYYYRNWTRYFWAGYFEQWEKIPNTKTSPRLFSVFAKLSRRFLPRSAA
jgi:glycosyltransferase involved in cell wall biosynthesis